MNEINDNDITDYDLRLTQLVYAHVPRSVFETTPHIIQRKTKEFRRTLKKFQGFGSPLDYTLLSLIVHLCVEVYLTVKGFRM